jgi:carbonic anhydrase
MSIARRHLLAGLLACPVCAAGLARAADAPHWNYTDEGPDKWGDIDPASKVCSIGNQQSPIDLHDGIRAELPGVKTFWRNEAYAVANNGHTIQCDAAPGSYTMIGDQRFDLAQFHFHTPSEHAVSGKRTAMEVHFVHKQGDVLAVIGVFMVPGPGNPAFSAIMRAAPGSAGKAALGAPVDAGSMLPKSLTGTWRYEGSLTTPPCSQIVNWIVMEQPINVAQADIDKFAGIFKANARPIQDINRRFILRS